MKHIPMMLLLLCTPFSGNARVHTVLDSKTIAKLQMGDIPKVRHITHNIHHSKYKDIVSQAASLHGVDENLVHAIIQTESSYNPSIESYKGAVGLMQLMPDTATRFGVTDRSNPTQNVNGGTKYLKFLIKLFNADLPLVVAAYNAGENAVIKYHKTIPPYPETRNYVKQVLALYNNS